MSELRIREEFESRISIERAQEIERIDAMFASYRQPILFGAIDTSLVLSGVSAGGKLSAYVLSLMMAAERNQLVAALDKVLDAKREKFYLEQQIDSRLRPLL